jgi:hypothetical protein
MNFIGRMQFGQTFAGASFVRCIVDAMPVKHVRNAYSSRFGRIVAGGTGRDF